MGLAHSPSIVMNGLVLALDAGNTKSFDDDENLLTYSNNFSQSPWGSFCGSTTGIVYNTTDVISPDGTNNSTKIAKTVDVCAGTSPAFGIWWTGSQLINKTDTYTASIYVRGAVGGETVVIGLADSRAQAYTLTTSWQRITYTGINDTTDYNTDRSFQVYAQGSNVTYYIWGAQLEKSSVASPYYATTGTAKNRGTTWTDLSGRDNHHTITGGPSYNSTNLGRFTLNGSTQGFTRTSAINGVSSTNTVVIWYSTSDGQELWVRGNQNNAFYLSASQGNNYYHANVGSPTNWVDLNSVTNPVTGGYRNGNYHMWEAKSVDFSSWTYYEWFLYPSGWQMAGNVSCIMIYNRNLTTDESKQNFNALRSRYGI